MSTQPGWHDDPTARFDSRFWDGNSWTPAVMRNGVVEQDSTNVETALASTPGFNPGAPMPPLPPLPLVAGGTAATQRITSLPPQEAQARLVQMLTVSGFTVQASGPGQVQATITTKGEPNVMITVLLVLLWIIPAIIYWLVKSKAVDHQVGLTFAPARDGTMISAHADQGGMQRLAPILGQLPW